MARNMTRDQRRMDLQVAFRRKSIANIAFVARHHELTAKGSLLHEETGLANSTKLSLPSEPVLTWLSCKKMLLRSGLTSLTVS